MVMNNMGCHGGGGRVSSRTGGGSPLKKGEPETIRTRYHKNAYGNPYDDEALDASFDAKKGVLSFDNAKNKDWDNDESPSNKIKYLSITVDNGMINGKPVNLDLSNSKIKAISGDYLSDKAKNTIEKSGFAYNSRTKLYEKGYKGYSMEGSTLYADSALPSSFDGVKKIKTKYGAVDTRPIKQAGYKWNGTEKVWEKK